VSRVNLDVPYHDRNLVRQLGARWDDVEHLWYVPEGRDPSPFVAWLPASYHLNVRAPFYYIAETSHECARCVARTRAYGFLLPPGHAVLNVGDTEEDDTWDVGDEATIISFITHLVPSVADRLRRITPLYRLSQTLQDPTGFWYNHCERCGWMLSETQLFEAPGAGFLAFTEQDAARISLLRVDAGFAACAQSYSYGVPLLEYMRLR